MEMVRNPDRIKEMVEERGMKGPLFFMLLNMLQVIIAVIPSGPFSLAAGYIWGVWKGTLICLIPTSFISVIIFLLVRRFGMRFARFFVSDNEHNSFGKILYSGHVRRLLLFIFMILMDRLCQIF